MLLHYNNPHPPINHAPTQLAEAFPEAKPAKDSVCVSLIGRCVNISVPASNWERS